MISEALTVARELLAAVRELTAEVRRLRRTLPNPEDHP